MMNYIEKFWNGNISLGISFWFVHTLLSIPVGVVVGSFFIFLTSSLESALTLIKIFHVGWVIFISVGTWRSASEYWENPKNQGKRGWSVAAKIGIIMGIWTSILFLTTSPFNYASDSRLIWGI
jgi:hypothetical protein